MKKCCDEVKAEPGAVEPECNSLPARPAAPAAPVPDEANSDDSPCLKQVRQRDTTHVRQCLARLLFVVHSFVGACALHDRWGSDDSPYLKQVGHSNRNQQPA
jgi:hypothetical protein